MDIKKIPIIIISILIVLSVYVVVIPLAQTTGDTLAVNTTITTTEVGCFQEQTNITHANDGGCTQNYTGGTYEHVGVWNVDNKALDGIWNPTSVSACSPGNTCYLISNYTKPVNTTNDANVTYATFNSANFTLALPTICVTQNPVSVQYCNENAGGGGCFGLGAVDGIGCFNGTDYERFSSVNTNNLVEEAIVWDIDISTTSDSGVRSIPLGGLFSSSGVIFIVIMAGLVMIIVKFIKFKNGGN